MNKKRVFQTGFILSAVLMAGCASAPSVMSSHSAEKHPTLNRAMENTSKVIHWKGCSGSFGKYYKECQTEFIFQSVGPAPLIAGSVKSSGMPGGMGGLTDSFHIAQIVTGAVMTGMGGVASGNIALGVAGLLLGGSSPDLEGLHQFQNGNELYAVRFMPTKQEAKRLTVKAAELEAHVPATFSGELVGNTSWKSMGVVWEPHEMRWRLGSGSYEVVYKARPARVSVNLSPVALWVTKLKPLTNNYAVTDQWTFENVSDTLEKNDAQKLSELNSDWIFVLGRHEAKPLVCIKGVCKVPYGTKDK